MVLPKITSNAWYARKLQCTREKHWMWAVFGFYVLLEFFVLWSILPFTILIKCANFWWYWPTYFSNFFKGVLFFVLCTSYAHKCACVHVLMCINVRMYICVYVHKCSFVSLRIFDHRTYQIGKLFAQNSQLHFSHSL